MLLALGAVSSAMDALQSLTSSKASSPHTTGFGQNSSNPFDLPSSSVPGSSAPASVPSGFSQLSPATMTALLAAQARSSAEPGTPAPTSRSVALNHLFSHLDTEPDGNITKSEFEAALGAGGTNVAKADDVFGKLDTNGDGSISLQELASALTGGHHGHHAGSEKVTMTSPAAKTAPGSATSSYNFIEQMIAREAQAISSGVSASLSLNV